MLKLPIKSPIDWSLITGREGGQLKFYPYKKGVGGGKSFSHEGGGGRKKFPPFKSVAQNCLPCLEEGGGGGGHEKCRSCDFPIS